MATHSCRLKHGISTIPQCMRMSGCHATSVISRFKHPAQDGHTRTHMPLISINAAPAKKLLHTTVPFCSTRRYIPPTDTTSVFEQVQQAYKWPWDLNRLIKVHLDKKFTCEVCSKVFQQEHLLKRHMTKHSDKFKYMCPKCGLKQIGQCLFEGMFSDVRCRYPLDQANFMALQMP